MHTKDKIVATALKLFVAQGIDKTSTAQICKEVGIASGSLFVHFSTKQDLIDHIYLERKKSALAHAGSAVDPDASVRDNILKLSQVLIAYFVEHHDDFLFCQMMEQRPQISDVAKALYEEEVAQSASVIDGWKQQGALKDIETGLFKDIWWSMLSAFIRRGKQASGTDLEVVWDALKA